MPADTNGGAPMLSVRDVAERLGVHPQTVYRWIHSGDMPAYRYGRPVTPGEKGRRGSGAIRIPATAIAPLLRTERTSDA
ncbi:helix-turn-helix domain-containing protein [Streptomyces chumphonensis]|uniref:helix-turn-helix domain-containing protein n=1 Tax=Streptomyces chumphonensis TaxID=1214925 RepID=UPI003D76380F